MKRNAKKPVEPTGMCRTYAERIAILHPGANARHVEAAMRANVGTLDHLDHAAFRREAAAAVREVTDMGADLSERLAKSYGL